MCRCESGFASGAVLEDQASKALANSLPQFSVDNKRAIDIWERSVEVVEGHYQMDIPFKSMLPNLPDNRIVAVKGLQSLACRLRKDPVLHVKYKGGIRELLDKGYAERVLDEEIGATPGQTWYLLHHNFVNEKKPISYELYLTVQRPGGTSLNKEFYQALTLQTISWGLPSL